MRSISCLVVILGLILTIHGATDVEIENKNVDRTVDIISQLVKISYKITLEHKSKKNINTYDFVVPEKDAEHLSYFSARDAAKKELKASESKVKNGVLYRLTFANPSASPVIYIETVFTKALQPYPTEIAQQDKQLVRYFGHLYFYSPYKTLTQKTTVHLASRNVESYTQVKPVSQAETVLNYGPYENIPSFAEDELVIHYENHSPFLTVTRLERTIEVSHWGNIAIEETIDMIHSGAILKGSFSRYDFQKDTRSGQASVKSYKTILPASASGVYYRDTNGNISTSAMRILKDSVELDLRPRFPLFGGWKTHYTLGYNVPSFEYLFSSGDNYLLKLRAIDHIFDDMAVDELHVKIILPEGSKNIKLITPFSVTRHSDSLHYTYLDTFGRPVISFTKRNLVENHIGDLNLKYSYSRIMMLQEPLLVVGFFMILFVLVIIWMRLDFTISREKEVHHHKE
ncbi:Dolichyl-diphosphooligosaccharide--protein glycosyltransferase subunit 1 [Sergentomyia squamirostris]